MVSETNYEPGVRLAIDFGQVRIGVAKCGSDGILATPLTTITHDDESVKNILSLALEIHAKVIYVGHPVNLKGEKTQSTEHAVQFAKLLAQEINEFENEIQVRLVDERLTTVSASELLRASGRDNRESKQLIDQAAATQLLDFALEIERKQGTWAGSQVNLD